ncbi:uncharacterized protein [Watersipora subatra]|uniref:uncharacterized protein n=1 Tax=Watersipora subatra TaxID=2589382 RepID=UPI00355C4996
MTNRGLLARWLLISVTLTLLAHSLGFMTRNARSRSKRAAAIWSPNFKNLRRQPYNIGAMGPRHNSYTNRNRYGPLYWGPTTSTVPPTTPRNIQGDPVECTRTGSLEGARGPSGTICFRQFEIVCDDAFPEDGQPRATRELGIPGPKGASSGDGSPPGFVCDTENFGQPGPPGDDACRRIPTIVCPDLP